MEQDTGWNKEAIRCRIYQSITEIISANRGQSSNRNLDSTSGSSRLGRLMVH